MRSSVRLTIVAAVAVLLAPAAQTLAAPQAAVETLERVVAVIEERPLLLSDVRALARVRGLGLAEAREAAIDERLMYGEASRVTQAEVTRDEEAAALAALLDRQPALVHEVAPADLRRLVHRQLTILKYVDFRFRPQVRVSDEDVRKAWEAEEVGRPSGLALEDAQDAIRARLERRELDQRIESWVAELRVRAALRYVEPAPAP